MVRQTDILICGSGSAGLCAAAWFAKCGVDFTILDKRPGPMERGQADGVQCRTVEVFESFGIAEDLLRASYHVLEVAFWSLNEQGKLIRAKRVADTEPGLSHMPHVILNQARLNAILLDYMHSQSGREVAYGYAVKHVQLPSTSVSDPAHAQYPVSVIAEKDGNEEIFHAKYVLGCDGAHSSIRKSLGYRMLGDSTDAIWGVMDIYPRTAFPDIRRKATIHSASGNLLIIPREGGSLVRFYVELPPGTQAQHVTLADLHATARRIFTQYDLDFSETYWWSAYSIGQRLVDHFTASAGTSSSSSPVDCQPRVFLTGDACHTHSPKAGQGMNVSLQDGYNLGWKLAHVLQNRASPLLLRTYERERGMVAKDLIDFDRELMQTFSKKGSANAKEFSEAFIKAGRYTAGLTAKYEDSEIVAAGRSQQGRAPGLVVGMRFPSAQVVRFCDARAMQLVRALPADGRWRIVVFAGKIGDGKTIRRLERLAKFLEGTDGPVKRFTPNGADVDAFIEPIVVFSGKRVELEQELIPPYFWPETGKWKMRDIHKVFVDDESYNSGHGHAYQKYGVNVADGVLAIVRPDQYVSLVTDLDDHRSVGQFFEGVCL
ncbi:hypothetical protein EV356DRAFT_531648 [Viridothelium virens]|uniref:Phenol 2-monooxygenase n=1 Tax=Viridothelium virens TaxID=1048519 RepID=A0A6A6HCN0_VIRVR|nr:hypothetical protein EV356DRAFT_531648 [Viridothelium virens]